MNELTRALIRWQYKAGPYWPFVATVPFLRPFEQMPEVPATVPTRELLLQAASAIEELQQGVVFLDLPPLEALRAAPKLNQQGFYVVPVIQRWMASSAALECSEVLGLLLALSHVVKRPKTPRGVVFLLDGNRNAPPTHVAPDAFDNRYQYSVSPFPSPEFLRRRGLQRLLWISTRHPADDVLVYLNEVVRKEHDLELRVLAGCQVLES